MKGITWQKIGAVTLVSILIVAGLVYISKNQTIVRGSTEPYDVKNFNSYKELNTFLQKSLENTANYNQNIGGMQSLEGAERLTTFYSAIASEDSSSKTSGNAPSVDYSGTNIQVAGVDEPDIIKTDGTYLYVVSNNTIKIIYAYPAENTALLSTITVNQTQSIQNIFISDTRLIVFTQNTYYPILYTTDVVYETNAVTKDAVSESSSYMPPWYNNPETNVIIYDITDKTTPTQIKDIVIGGTFSDARLIGDYVYVITVQYSYNNADENQSPVPRILENNQAIDVPLSDIYYVDTPEKSTTLTNIVSINVHNDYEQIHAKIFLIGSTQTIYVSQNNIYITASTWYYDYTALKDMVDRLLIPILPASVKSQLDLVQTLDIEDYQKQEVTQWIIQKYAQSIPNDQKQSIIKEVVKETERTIIHRISINEGSITYESQGNVFGYINNQFSLSENNGHLYVSTTVQGSSLWYFFGSVETQNNVYVLDMDLYIVGSVENIAPGESIYATRFIGDKCYLVTYRQTDPFFVIDLSTPTDPIILGQVKIPGYSTYLHPYDDTHIIGIGKDGSQVKISLFDVSDMTNPVELANCSITDGENSWWSDSSALYEHKAFLFDLEKHLLVIPIGSYYKQSAYVFSISVDNGISLRGNISHDLETQHEDEPYYMSYYDSGNSIQRTLFIENVLYTISTNMIKMNNLETLAELNSIDLI
ncbi:MAG: beta-propeller domain-containing protein [Euryarchaeota archaeon]|nr:beta-propeller domain-containing protein [Euryarchaeota archaeon]